KQPAATGLLDQMFIVLSRFKTEQGEFKAVLTTRFPMASSRVATSLGKYRDDLIGKVDGFDLLKVLDSDGQRGGQTVLAGYGQHRGAVPHRQDPARLVNPNLVGRRHRVTGLAGVITPRARSDYRAT